MSTILTSDPREQLIANIRALRNVALEVGPGAASVLSSLIAALLIGEEDLLSAHTVKFSEDVIRRLGESRKTFV